MNAIENQPNIGHYDNDILMLMYDDVVIRRRQDLVNNDFQLL